MCIRNIYLIPLFVLGYYILKLCKINDDIQSFIGRPDDSYIHFNCTDDLEQWDMNHVCGESFYSKNYDDAKRKFLNAAKFPTKLSNQPEHLYYPITDKVGNDVIILRGRSDRFVLHISGTHGPEGFVGSAIQTAMLTFFKKHSTYENKDLPTLVFVHALNAYGFKHNRRVNENNVDLNRNFLLKKEFESVLKRDPNFAGYEDIEFMINPTHMPTSYVFINDLYTYALTVYAALHIGIGNIKKAIVSGNYYKQVGLGFGGFEQEKSTSNLINIVNRVEIPEKAKMGIIIDVHSGLGPTGVDTLMVGGFGNKLEKDDETCDENDVDCDNTIDDKIESFTNLIKKIYTNPADDGNYVLDKDTKNPRTKGPIIEFEASVLELSTKKIQNETGATAGYELTVGQISESFCKKYFAPKLKNNNRICLTQEFGTEHMIRVGKALSDENYAYHYGTDNEKNIYGERLQDVFYVKNKIWKKNTIGRGMDVLFKSLDHLMLNEKT